MAGPVYSTDLTTLATADESDSGWGELTSGGYNAMGTPAFQDADYPFIQGSYSITQDCTKDNSLGSVSWDEGTGTGGHGTDGAYFVWQNFQVPTNIETYANGGLRLAVGSSTDDFYVWYVGGKDKGNRTYGGWQCHVVNTTVSVDGTVGTPTATEQVIGAAVYVVTGPKKGEVHNVDAIRYGRGSAIFEQGQISNPATFAGFAAINDLQANRWGLIQETPGGYLWQGHIQFGSDTTGCVFVDSNETLFVNWTPKVTTNFNTIEVINPETYVSMTGIIIQVLDTSTASRGRFIMSDPATVYLDQCIFSDMNEFVFDCTSDVNIVQVTNTNFRYCGQITQDYATISGSSIIYCRDEVSVLASDAELITNCSFESDGSNHAIKLDENHAGRTINISNVTFVGYATSDGDTGNEAIYNDSTGHVNINVTGGTFPYVRNGLGATTTVTQTINWYFKIVDGDGNVVNTAEFRIYDDDNKQLFGVETSDGTELYSFASALSGTNARVVVHDLNYIHNSQTLVHPSTSNSAASPTVIVLAVDRVYENPT